MAFLWCTGGRAEVIVTTTTQREADLSRPELRANAYTTGAPAGSSVRSSSGQDGSDRGIFGQRFHSSGAKTEPEFLFIPMALAVDTHPGAATVSNSNGVLEPGESVVVEPTWLNHSVDSWSLTGGLSGFEGPVGGIYSLIDTSADYGFMLSDAIRDCNNGSPNACYAVSVAGTRPSTHWDAVVQENLSPGGGWSWTLHIGDSFADAPVSHPFYRFIENLLHNGVAAGCGGGDYCPGNPVTRGQMAVFLLKARFGAAYLPPACVAGAETFGDVAAANPFCRFIEDLSRRGITAGCGGGNYCPGNPVDRAQVSVFLLKMLEGAGYLPAACVAGAETFGDVAAGNPYCRFIEELYRRTITAGCGPTSYCPGNPVTRGQAAAFLVKTFLLLLYGP